MTKFKHDNKSLHNLESPNLIVPEVLKFITPKSVVDIGCGLGNFLHVFKQNGVEEILGVNGPWVEKELLFKYIDQEEFLEWDLEKEIVLDKKYDLAVNLEVAEHLNEKAADTIVKTLVNAGEVVLFSAAIPLQGGQNHINEQPLTYWEEKFSKHGYVVHDIIRSVIWDNDKIPFWYRQNMVFIAPKEYTFKNNPVYSHVKNIVHPGLVQDKMNQIIELHHAKKKTSFYLKLFLKSLAISLGVKK
ncbi:MAG: methyltransferase domain-containing protein [Flavobacteriaceae bacterium]